MHDGYLCYQPCCFKMLSNTECFINSLMDCRGVWVLLNCTRIEFKFNWRDCATSSHGHILVNCGHVSGHRYVWKKFAVSSYVHKMCSVFRNIWRHRLHERAYYVNVFSLRTGMERILQMLKCLIMLFYTDWDSFQEIHSFGYFLGREA